MWSATAVQQHRDYKSLPQGKIRISKFEIRNNDKNHNTTNSKPEDIPVVLKISNFDGIVKSQKSSFFVISRHECVSGNPVIPATYGSPDNFLSGDDGHGTFYDAVMVDLRAPRGSKAT